MTNFAIECIPEVDEGPEGFVLRSFATNGFSNIGQMKQFFGTLSLLNVAANLGWSFKRPSSGISRYSGMPEGETWWRKEPRCLQGLDKPARPKAGLRFCPACLAEREVRLEVWNVEGFWACPQHHCYLRHTCHVCGTPERLPRVGLAHCYSCGAPHSDAPQVHADADTLAIAHLIRFGDNDIFPPALSDIGGLTIDACRLFSPPNRPGVDLRRDVLSKEPIITPEVIANWSKRSASVLCNWPSGFEDWLDKRADPSPSAIGPQRFGGWLSRVRNELGRLPAVREAVYNYLWSRWDRVPLAGEGNYFSGETPPDHILVPKHAAQLIGVAPERIKFLIAEGKLEGRSEVRGKNTYCYVSRDSVERYIAKMRDFASADQVRGQLGTQKAVSRELVAAGLLEMSPKRRASRYLVESVNGLISRLDAVCVQYDGTIDLVRLADISPARRVKLVNLLPHILSRTIPCFRVTGEGLAGFAVPLESMLGYFYEDDSIFCNYGRVAEITGLTFPTIRACADSGLLELLDPNPYKINRIFSIESAQSFHDRCIGSREIVRRTKMTPTAAAELLRARDVSPAVISDPIRKVVSYWRRDEVAEVFGKDFLTNQHIVSNAQEGRVMRQYRKRSRRQLYEIIPASR